MKGSLHTISSDNGIRLVSFTYKNLLMKSTTFVCKNINLGEAIWVFCGPNNIQSDRSCFS